MSPRENAALKARRMLGEGRVRILRVEGPEIDAEVRGDTAAVYAVQHRPGSWSCPCEALSTLCSHVRAVQLVTVTNQAGWRSITEITDQWRDVPVQPWELVADERPHGNKADR